MGSPDPERSLMINSSEVIILVPVSVAVPVALTVPVPARSVSVRYEKTSLCWPGDERERALRTQPCTLMDLESFRCPALRSACQENMEGSMMMINGCEICPFLSLFHDLLALLHDLLR